MDNKLRLGWPNRITIGRLLLIGPFVVCLLNLNRPGYDALRWVAVTIFTLMAVSDGLDGYLARRLQAESQLGRFLDPLADKILITAAVVILCVRGVHDSRSDALVGLPNWVAVVAIAKEIVVITGFVLVYLSTGRVEIRPRRLGKWCTSVQLAMVLAVLMWADLPAVVAWVPQAMWIAASIMAIAAGFDYIQSGRQYLLALTVQGRPPKDGAS